MASLGHAFASVFHDASVGAHAIVGWEQKKVQPDAPQIEMLSGLIPGYGPEIVIMEQLAFAALGVLAQMLHESGTPEKAAGSNPGVDVGLLSQVETFLTANPTVITQAESLLAHGA